METFLKLKSYFKRFLIHRTYIFIEARASLEAFRQVWICIPSRQGTLEPKRIARK
jgi:hypothetical protein